MYLREDPQTPSQHLSVPFQRAPALTDQSPRGPGGGWGGQQQSTRVLGGQLRGFPGSSEAQEMMRQSPSLESRAVQLPPPPSRPGLTPHALEGAPILLSSFWAPLSCCRLLLSWGALSSLD